MRSAILCIVLVSFSFLSSALASAAAATTAPPPTTAPPTTTAAPTTTADHTGTTSTATASSVAAASTTISPPTSSQSGSTAAPTASSINPSTPASALSSSSTSSKPLTSTVPSSSTKTVQDTTASTGATTTPSIAPTTTAPTAIQCFKGTCDGVSCLKNTTITDSIPTCNKPEPGDCMVSTMTNDTDTQMMSECITECKVSDPKQTEKVVQCCQTPLCTEDTTKAPSRADSPSVTSTASLLITIVLYHCLNIFI